MPEWVILKPMISDEVVRRLKSTREWEAVEKHIKETIIALDTVNGIKGTEREIALEIKSRQHCIHRLLEILRPFIEFQERPDTKKLAEEAARDAGL